MVTEHPAARVGGTCINYQIPCQDPERGFAADGPLWDKVPWITSREVDPATTDAWQSLRETEALRGTSPERNLRPTPVAAHSHVSTHHHQDTSHFLGDHLSPGYQQSPDSRRLSVHEQRSEMARAVVEEDAAAAQQELEEVKKRAAEREAETKAKAPEVASRAMTHARPYLI